MSPASDYVDRALLEWGVLGAPFPSVAAPRYLALYTAPPTKAGGGTEVAAAGYARLALQIADFAVSGPPWVATNAVKLTYPAPLALWGTLTAIGVHDAPTGGNLLWLGALLTPRTPAVGQLLVFGLGSLRIEGRLT